MLNRPAALAAIVLALVGSAPAFAEPPHHRGSSGHHHSGHHNSGHHDRDSHSRGHSDHRYSNDYVRNDWYRYDNYRYDRYSDYRGWDHRSYRSHRWSPGYYVPNHTHYPRIHDYHGYRGHHLPPPGRGQYYVDVDGDILLIAAATGLIVWALQQ
jgi:Ni/Co efflux regulator RcnB